MEPLILSDVMHMSTTLVSRILPLALPLLMLGCSSELDPTDPEDAYIVFRDAMWDKNAAGVWDRLDPETQTYFETNHKTLLEMNTSILKYLPQADHRLARKQSGVVLTESVGDGKALFLKIFTPDKLPHDDAYKLGTEVAEVKRAENDLLAEIVTRGGQTFYMSRKTTSAEWTVMLLKSAEALGTSMKWIETNKAALTQTVDDLLAEERKERESIIAELMKP